MKFGKKYKAVRELVEKNKIYALEEACELVKKTSPVKFDATVDASFNLNVNPRMADQQIRGTINLPHGNGKTKKILAITNTKLEEAKEAGADFVGGVDMLEKIKNENWFGFDVIVATPEMMAELGKMGRLLGPRGLMPNPKTGTVAVDIGRAIEEIKRGKVEYRVDKDGNIHVSIARVSFETEKIVDNLRALCETIIKVRPASVKGTYVKNAVIHTTMGPSIKIAMPGR
ncbi:MAG: 50S ribosomal protein L1 [Bacilli bacterium]|jgi:large subunit ribosomal protein L1|nr:50S ribosomal protein L1 [Bacilli bacterium]